MSAWLTVALTLGVQGAPIEGQLTLKYSQWDRAYIERDLKAIENLLGPSFRLFTSRGRSVSRSDYLSRISRSRAPLFYETRLLRAERTGTSARAWTEEVSRDRTGDFHRHRYLDRWLLSGGRWQLAESRTLEED